MKIDLDDGERVFALWVLMAITLIVLSLICADCEKTKIKITGEPDISITK